MTTTVIYALIAVVLLIFTYKFLIMFVCISDSEREELAQKAVLLAIQEPETKTITLLLELLEASKYWYQANIEYLENLKADSLIDECYREEEGQKVNKLIEFWFIAQNELNEIIASRKSCL